jgi:predicted Fe-Mo cluster-binding NifX family protein
LHVIDTETEAHETHENVRNLHAIQGAGVQAAQAVVELGCQAVLVSHCGPKAFAVLSAAGITVYSGAHGSIADAVKAFSAGTLEKAEGADVHGHWA